MVREPDATMQPTLQDNQLMSKHRVLGFKPQLRLKWRGQDGQNETKQPDHSASLGDSITLSTGIRFSVHTGDKWACAAQCTREFVSMAESRDETIIKLRTRLCREPTDDELRAARDDVIRRAYAGMAVTEMLLGNEAKEEPPASGST
jgi:hypothetical protein